jgi:hypothetical protein
MQKAKKPFVRSQETRQALTIVLVLDPAFTSRFDRSSPGNPYSIHEGAGSMRFGVRITGR